ncbi:subtilisin-like protein [Lactarius psammicola]|nr:subtilisin-like protein [Lactarius psammicola]
MTVKHSWNAVPEFWESLGHPPADTTIDLYLELKPQHESALIDALGVVSDPRHPKYGKYLSKEQTRLNLVNSWLEDHRILPSSVSMTLGGVPVPQANDILGASYQLYQHVEVNNTVFARSATRSPRPCMGTFKTVVPTTYFGSPRTRWKKPRTPPHRVAAAQDKSGPEALVMARQGPQKVVTPSYLRELYDTQEYVPAAADRNAIANAGYDNEYPSPQDLSAFMREYRTDGVDATFDVVQINGGGNDPSRPGIEANLNLQFAAAMTYPTRNIYYSTGGELYTFRDPYLHWLAYVLKQESVPQTISTTYGGPEYTAPLGYAVGLCYLFAQLGTRGASVIFSSGDWGVGRGDCLVRGSNGQTSVRFLPEFPASCPWVTSVGGTTGDHPEVAASISGGGFSNYFPRPPYQKEAVPLFLQDVGDIYGDLFNPYGRGVPDISAQALNFGIFLNGRAEEADGTSGSAPTVAGIISLLNDFLLSKGRDPLGFLNPRLYGTGIAGLNDITFGDNPGCGTDGFPAVAGWDPVTGLGTPNFKKLKNTL